MESKEMQDKLVRLAAMAAMVYPDYLESKVSKEKLAKVAIQVPQDNKVRLVKLETLVQ